MSQVMAVRLTEYGGPEVLQYHAVRLPALEAGQVLVRHHAIGVNFVDTYHRSGLYRLDLPSGIGKEAVGVVEAVGEGVTRCQVGDRVGYVEAPVGAYAEAHIVPEQSILKIPETIETDVAAGAMLKGMTAAYLLLKTYAVTKGDWLLVHAAAGGVSSLLIPWAKALGAKVIGTVGSVEKQSIARANGCDHVILYRQQDVVSAVKQITSGRGVDVVYDSVGKDTFAVSIDCLKPRGLMASFGNASGAVEDFSPLLLAKKGSLYLTRPVLSHYVADPLEQQFLANALFDRILAGDLKPCVNQRLALADAASAHRLLESATTTGSMILLP